MTIWQKYLIILGFLIPVLSRAEQVTLSMSAPGYWCPYTCSTDANVDGFVVDIVREVYRRNGYALNFSAMNYDRALLYTHHGENMLIAPVYPGEVKGLIMPKLPITKNKLCFYTMPNSEWQYQGLSSLDGVTLGVISGYAYGALIDDYIQTYRQDPKRVDKNYGESITKQMVRKLSAKRFDVFIEDQNLILFFLKQNPKHSLREASCLAPTQGYLAISPHVQYAQHLAALFDQTFPQLERDGTLNHIMEKYGLSRSLWVSDERRVDQK